MKIVHVSYRRARSGYTNPGQWIRFLSFFTGILEALSHHAQIVAIYHIDCEGVVSHNGVSYQFPGLTRWQLLFPFKLNASIARMQPDVVVVHGLIFSWQVLMLRCQVGKRTRIIAQHHSERPLKHFRRLFQKLADRHIKKYLFASYELGLQWVQAGLIRDKNKIQEVMVASSSFTPMEKGDARKITGVTGEKVFLWVGRLDVNKDPITVVRAFIAFSHANPGVSLYMIFQASELLGSVRALLPDANAGAVHLIGKVEHEDLRYWYNSADYVVSGSHYEGAGIAVCEGISCGCIPVLTDIPSFRMMTNGGNLGVLYPAGKEAALVEALTKVSRLDMMCERRRALEWFRDNLSPEAIANRIMTVVSEVTQQPWKDQG